MSQQGYEPIPDGNSVVPQRPSRSRLGIVVAGGGLLVFLMQFLFLNNNGIRNGEMENPSISLLDGASSKIREGYCKASYALSQFDLLDTDNYEKYIPPESTMTLAQTGTFVGPKSMAEYVDFTRSKFFDFYLRYSDSEIEVVKAKNGECEIMAAVQNKMQVKPKYSNSGEGVCVIALIGFKVLFTPGLLGKGLSIENIKLFYPEKFLPMLFNDAIGGPAVTDYICDTVLRDNCQEVYKANGLEEKSCKTMYDALPPTDEYGYLDEKTKGCRILHSAFAETNKGHCPHMSFIPIKDYMGNYWCQESGGKKAEDFWSDDQLAFLKDAAINSFGFDPVTLSTTCDYEPQTDVLGGNME